MGNGAITAGRMAAPTEARRDKPLTCIDDEAARLIPRSDHDHCLPRKIHTPQMVPNA
jgi:hypothetical protein